MSPSSDLVQESKLETTFSPAYTQHTFYKRGKSGREWKIRIQERWTRKRRLGQGACGTVWLETCDRPARQYNPTVRAVKEIPIDSTLTEKVDYYRELEAVMKFSQERYTPSFVQSYGWFESSEAMFIAMEYVPHGDLQNYLSSPIPEDEARIITRQLAEGLHHMHMNGFTHRDLKPGNILVVSRGPDWLVQISDFGISRRLRPDQSTLGTMRRGTLGFIAPEMLGFITDRTHPYAVDIWSLGAVVFTMVTKTLFMTDFGLLQKYVTDELQFPSQDLSACGVTELLASFLQSLLSPLPKDRPTITEIMSHNWLQSSSNASEKGSSENDSEDDSEDDSSEDDSSKDDTSEGGIQSQDEVDPTDNTGSVASATWSTAIICAKTANETHKPSAISTTRETHKLSGIPPDLKENGLTGGIRLMLSKIGRTEPEDPIRPARFLVDEAGIIHRTECDMAHFDVYEEKKPGPEGQRKRLRFGPEEMHQPTLRSREQKTKSRQRRYKPKKSPDHVSPNQSKLSLNKQRNSPAPATTSATSKKQKETWAGIWPWTSTSSLKASSSRPSSSKKSSSASKKHTSTPKKSKATTKETPIMDQPIVHAEASINKPREITTVIRAHPYVDDISTNEAFTKNNTKSDGTDGERDRFQMNSASGQRVVRFVATRSDAGKYRIPPKYDLSRWDPRKTPLLFLYCVFDLISIGTWFNDTIMSCRQCGQSISDKDMEMIKGLAILLEKLDDKLSKIIQHSAYLQKADDKETIQDLTDSGERLVIKVQKFLQA
ncbi:unnamed protein product [Colletotrichum noveboracense]|uniref:Autophagy-related protein 1 n=1 Tax=Colletotrichum noveboracense TaxID=2664923 RepID=A0A9W4WBN2_9PEZI|nr:unnamed protein product [Colletotrichum noveboracense]